MAEQEPVQTFRPSIFMLSVSVLTIVFWFVATTPRARLNVMQVIAVFFAVTLAWRLRRGTLQPTPVETPGTSPLVLWIGIAAGAIVWTTTFNCYFVSDDYGLLYFARTPILSGIRTVFLRGDGGVFFRPLTYTSYLLDHAVWNSLPAGYHLTNLALHLAATAGVLAFLRWLDFSREAAATTAAVFVSMPIQVESVAWMAGRFDVLSGTLTIWAMAFYAWSRKQLMPGYALALLFYILAMCSKETGFLLPALLIALEWIVFRSRPGLKLVPFLAIGAIVFMYRMSALGGFGGYKTGTGAASPVTDVGLKTIEGLFLRVPTQLLMGLNWTQSNGFAVVLTGAVLAALLILLVLSADPATTRSSMVLFAFGWMVIAAVPGHFMSVIGPGLSNSRILYLPSAGAAMLLGQLISGIRMPRVRQLACIAVFVVFNAGVLHNLGAWRSTSGLAKDTLADITRIVPAPAPGTQFVFSGLPDSIRGVFFFRAGLTEGLRMVYNREDVSGVRDSDPAENQTSSDAHPTVRLLWKGEPGQLLVHQP